MFKITYEGEPYYYSSGKQAYTTKAEIVMDNEACFSDILEATLKMTEFATYPKQTRTGLKNMIDNLDYNFAEEKEEIEHGE
jgi:hypothetical protein